MRSDGESAMLARRAKDANAHPSSEKQGSPRSLEGLWGPTDADLSRTLITAYVPAMYITQATSHANDRSDPPIRAISKSHSPEGSAKWDAPNHLTGIAAALHSMVCQNITPFTV